MDASTQDLENTILQALYDAFFSKKQNIPLQPFCKSKGWDTNRSDEVIRGLESEGLIKLRPVAGGSYKLTVAGIISSEERGLIDTSIVQAHEATRKAILDYMNQVYKNSTDRSHGCSYSQIQQDLEATTTNLLQNFNFLRDSDEIEDLNGSIFRLWNFDDTK